MWRKGLIIGLAVIVVGMGIVIPALAKTDLPPSAQPRLSSAPDPQGKVSLVVWPAVITGDPKKMPLTILGSGFEPGEELAILISMGGVLSDISYLMKPMPKANEFGAFAGDIDFGPDIWRRKLVEAGAYTFSAYNMLGNLLATAPVLFVAPPKK